MEGKGHAWKVHQLSGQGSCGCRTIIRMDEAHWIQRRKLKDSSQQHRIRHRTPDTTANTSPSKEPQTDAECAIPSQKLWNTSYQGAKH